MKILIATKNESKIQGAREAFETFYENVEIKGVSIPSNVPEEPINEEIMHGAENRITGLVKYAEENNLEIDFYLSVESGLINLYGRWINTSIALIRDKYGFEAHGMAPGYPIPDKYVDEVIQSDLTKVYDRIFSQNELQEHKGGVRLLTHGRMTRADLIMEAFLMAMTQIINGDIWH